MLTHQTLSQTMFKTNQNGWVNPAKIRQNVEFALQSSGMITTHKNDQGPRIGCRLGGWWWPPRTRQVTKCYKKVGKVFTLPSNCRSSTVTAMTARKLWTLWTQWTQWTRRVLSRILGLGWCSGRIKILSRNGKKSNRCPLELYSW